MKSIYALFLFMINYISVCAQTHGGTFVASLTPVYRLDVNSIAVVPTIGYGLNFRDRAGHFECFGISLDFSRRSFKSTNNLIVSTEPITEVPINLFWIETAGKGKTKSIIIARIGFNYVHKNFNMIGEQNGIAISENVGYKSGFSAGLGAGLCREVTDKITLFTIVRADVSTFRANSTSGLNYRSEQKGIIGNSGISIGVLYQLLGFSK